MSQIGETLHSNRQITPRRNRRHGQKRPQNGSSATSVDRASLLASPNGTIKINDGQFNASAGHLFNVTINAGSDRMPPNSRASERTILSEKTNQMPLRRSSNQDFKTSESEPETSLPITPTQESWDIYYRLLAPKGHGSPLYIPEPNNTLNLEYRRTGIRIGDVGIITSSGFDFLFNICLPANHPINPKELPETFEPLLVNPADIQKYSKFKGEGYLSSPSIKKKSNRNGDSSGLIFESSASEGALLTMPVGSKSEDLRNVKEFRRYFTLHAENWYKYVNNVRGREARNGDIRLVTGCDKTSQWGMATFSNSTAPNDSFHLTFRSVEQSNIGRTYVCQEYSGMTEVRAGPDAEEIQELRNNDPSQEGTTYNNQGLFVRSLSLTLNNDIWNKLATEFGDVHVDESPDDSYHNSRSFVPNSAASGGSSSTPLSQSTTTSHANSGACRALATINCFSNQAIQCAHFSLSSSAQALTGHPSDALNDMLLNLHPNARFAVTEDKDWISVMNENDATLPPTEELCTRMMSSFTFREEEGILFWEKKEKEVYNLDFPLYLGPKTLVLDWAALPEISSVPQDCPSQIDNDPDGKKSHTRQLVSKDYYEPGAGKSLSQLDAQNREKEAHARMLETQKREAEARAATDEARKREAKVQEDLRQAKFYLAKGIQPEVWPTKEEFDSAKNRIQYDPEKIHFAVCGSSGSGKSSLVNAFRGLKNSGRKNNSFEVAPTGVVETTLAITRYPDPRKEMPYNRLVWFDCPGAGTLEIPGWQYFNQQGLFIFDIIILVYDSRFTQIDVSIIQNAERFNIPLFVVRSKADVHIRNIMQDLGYDEDDDDADDDHYEDCQAQARQLLIDSTKNNLEENLQKAELPKHDVFIVSNSVIYSLITGKRNKKPEIDEVRLVEAVLKRAHERRYGTQAPAKNHSTLVKDKTARDLVSPHD